MTTRTGAIVGAVLFALFAAIPARGEQPAAATSEQQAAEAYAADRPLQATHAVSPRGDAAVAKAPHVRRFSLARYRHLAANTLPLCTWRGSHPFVLMLGIAY